MTRKLYYEDSYLSCFKGMVISCEPYKEGYVILLDQTAFYPEGGGQPSDIGILGDVRVEHVFIKEDKIYHVTDKPLESGQVVEGKIDFKRRFDFMQQHSGEHIISGLIKKHYGYNNVGFHLSDEYMTADVDGELKQEQIIEIEREANSVVFRNIPISAVIYEKNEVQEIDYRSKIDIIGKVRIVKVGDYDTCACCGTHVRYTGEIGLIKCVGMQRHRGGMRLTLVCGERALRDYHQKQEVISSAVALLSAQPLLIEESIKKLQEELVSYKQKLVEYKSQLMRIRVEEYVKESRDIVCVYEEDLSGDDLRRLCLMLIEKTDKVCVVLTTDKEQLKYAIGARDIDVRELCKALNQNFNGRGGGKPELCQGGVCSNRETVQAFVREWIN